MFSKRVVPTSILTFTLLLLFSSVADAVGSISGQVKLEHEVALLPVVGASVTAISEDSHFVAMALTDSNGQYQINNLQVGNYKVVACKRDLGCLFYPDTRHPDSAKFVMVVEDQTASGINITFRPFVPPPPPNPAFITGRITDAQTGEGIVDAYVAARGEFLTIIFETRSGPDGRYSLPVVAGGYFVGAAARGYTPGEYTGNPVRVEAYDTASGIDIALSPSPQPPLGYITGRVTDAATGNGIAEAYVVAKSPDSSRQFFETRTGPDGYYRLAVWAGDFRPEEYYVWADARGYESAPYSGNPVLVGAWETIPDVNIALHPIADSFGLITGLITDSATGNHLLGARVIAFIVRDNVFPIVYETFSDTDGGYALRVPPDSYHVFAEKPGYIRGEYPGNPVPVGPNDTVRGIDIALNAILPHPVGFIAGRITDAQTGEGIPDAWVGASGEVLRIIFETRTGPDGRYFLSVSPEDRYNVRAAARGYEVDEYPGNPVAVEAYDTVFSVNIALFQQPISIDLGSISGQVANAADGSPIPHALVVARQGDGFGFGTAFTDENGNYRIGPLPAGFYKVAALARGFFPAVYPDRVEVRGGENTPDINLRLRPVPPPDLGTISGMVTDDSTGAPIACAIVAAVGFDSTFRHRIVRFAHTDSTGNYVIGGLPRLLYFVIAWARGYFAEIYDNVHRFEDATKVTPDASGINFTLQKKDSTAHSLAGIVTSNSGIPEAGALVTASSNGSVNGAALTLPDGGFLLDGLVSGSYTVSAARDEASTSKNVDLSGGSVSGLSLTLPTGTALRGDINQNGTYEPADVVLLITAAFSDPGVLPDRAAADVNCDGQLTPADVVAELLLVFSAQSSLVCGF